MLVGSIFVCKNQNKYLFFVHDIGYNIDIGKEVMIVDIIEKLTSLANALTPLVLALAILKLVSKE